MAKTKMLRACLLEQVTKEQINLKKKNLSNF
jgi:hypothetical protein